MLVLITGANGFLGQHLTLFLSNMNISLICSGKGDCRMDITVLNKIKYIQADLTIQEEVNNLIDCSKPDWVIHCAAMSKPNDCHFNREDCITNNLKATEYLVKASEINAAKFLYMSSDFVFGENGPNREDDIPAPLNFYGESKLLAEQIVATNSQHWVIIRPVLIYGKQLAGTPASFLHWVQNNLEKGNPIKVVNDQLRTPTYVGDICEGIYKAITTNAKGIYHLAGDDVLSPYQMAICFAETYGLDTSLITPVSSDTFIEPVIRAKKGGLINDKAKREIGFTARPFKEAIKLFQ